MNEGYIKVISSPISKYGYREKVDNKLVFKFDMANGKGGPYVE